VRILSFFSQKGGSGKTTLAVHSAVTAHEAGDRVVLIDTDPQKSATVWGDARTAEAPIVATAGVSELARVLDAARAEGMGLAIIDAAPHAAPEASKIVRASDLVVIPVRPSVFDVAAVEGAVRIVRAAGARAVFVLSACPFRAPEIAETRAALAGYDLTVAPTEITDRRAFSRALATGRAVTEFEAEGKAADEIKALWGWLGEQLA
jgi:chromosome partitioning protein